MILPSPCGLWLLTADTTHLTGLTLAPVGSRPTPPANALEQAAATQVAEFFAGQRRSFDLPLHFPAGFTGDVWRALCAVPFGQVATYGQIAAQVGRPGAARAVGTACGKNPVALVVPCHRIVRADGSPGAYMGVADSPLKQRLLAFEAGHADTFDPGQGSHGQE